jgi:hypothetical protein
MTIYYTNCSNCKDNTRHIMFISDVGEFSFCEHCSGIKIVLVNPKNFSK